MEDLRSVSMKPEPTLKEKMFGSSVQKPEWKIGERIETEISKLNVARKQRELRIKNERLIQAQEARKYKDKYSNMLEEARLKARVELQAKREAYFNNRQRQRRPTYQTQPRRIDPIYAMTQDRGFISGRSPFDEADPFSAPNPLVGRGRKKNPFSGGNPFGL